MFTLSILQGSPGNVVFKLSCQVHCYKLGVLLLRRGKWGTILRGNKWNNKHSAVDARSPALSHSGPFPSGISWNTYNALQRRHQCYNGHFPRPSVNPQKMQDGNRCISSPYPPHRRLSWDVAICAASQRTVLHLNRMLSLTISAQTRYASSWWLFFLSPLFPHSSLLRMALMIE